MEVLAGVADAQGRAFYHASEDGKTLEVTRTLKGSFDVAPLVNWRNSNCYNVRPGVERRRRMWITSECDK